MSRIIENKDGFCQWISTKEAKWFDSFAQEVRDNIVYVKSIDGHYHKIAVEMNYYPSKHITYTYERIKINKTIETYCVVDEDGNEEMEEEVIETPVTVMEKTYSTDGRDVNTLTLAQIWSVMVAIDAGLD